MSEALDLGDRFAQLAAAAPRADLIVAPGRPPLDRGACAQWGHERAAECRRWGLGRGDVLAWAVADRPATAAAMVALPAASTLAPLPAEAPDAMAGALLARLRPKALAVDAGTAPAWRAAAARNGIALIEVTVVPGAPAGAFAWHLALPTASLDLAPTLAPTVAFVCTTSGTTGRPKLVPLSHAQLVWTSLAVAERLLVGPGDRSAVLTPLHVANGMRTALLMPALAGASVEVLPESDVGTLEARLRAGRVTFVSTSFTVCRNLLARQRTPVRHPSLRFLRAASGALAAAEIGRLESIFGVPVVAGLATTETGVVTQQALPPAPRACGALGTPLGCEIRLLDAGSEEVAPGGIGEVHVRGPQVFAGYLDDPALDALVFADGWYRPGDLARFGDDGELRLVGRTREMINRGGEKIAPVEIDEALRDLPGVKDGAGFGVPHAILGEEVVAAVVLAQGVSLDVDAALARLRERMGVRRAPKRLWLVDALPRNAAGKLERVSLAGAFGALAPDAADATLVMVESPLVTAICALWADALGLDVVAPTSTFASLGGRANDARALVAAVGSVFDVAFDEAALGHEASTPEAMANAITRARG